ncbi:hypothetical protein Pcinc_043422 [Petrolisthes cinctipes]|uniref:Uncharacterized protein n=1 Tax=Petrolisthes cinctipes TaxID=88211 RepID=A0AAE1EG41_PETCI|nr:hypothetical protein Pcinc_043422 [Petrolisthes cinctipes]
MTVATGLSLITWGGDKHVTIILDFLVGWLVGVSDVRLSGREEDEMGRKLRGKDCLPVIYPPPSLLTCHPSLTSVTPPSSSPATLPSPQLPLPLPLSVTCHPSLTSVTPPLFPHFSNPPPSSSPATRPSPQVPLLPPHLPPVPHLSYPSSLLTCHPSLTSVTPPPSSPTTLTSL